MNAPISKTSHKKIITLARLACLCFKIRETIIKKQNKTKYKCITNLMMLAMKKEVDCDPKWRISRDMID